MSDNEVILSGKVWSAALPSTVLAFFYPRTAKCDAAPACRQRAEAAHRKFGEQYPDTKVPLLTLDQGDWREPFDVAEAREAQLARERTEEEQADADKWRL